MQDSWAILGVKGSGKTTVAQNLVPRLNQSFPGIKNYVLDSKGYGEYDTWAELPGGELSITSDPPDKVPMPGGISVWKPPLNDVQAYDRWFGMILRAQEPCIVLVDELASIIPKRGGDAPPNYRLLLKQGRIMGIAVISMSQEYAGIDRNTVGQADHLLRMFMINQYDRRESGKLLGFHGTGVARNPSHEHGIFYRRLDRPSMPTYEYVDYRSFLGIAA